MSRPRIGFLVSGPKGLSLLAGVHALCDVAFVSSHPVRGLQVNAYDLVTDFCARHGYTFVDRDAMSDARLAQTDYVFVAGWQYVIGGSLDRLVVFHDSLLPEVRGFAPTATALIAGRTRIGVTAFRPVEAFDAGPVYAQAPADIVYPLTIRAAYARIAGCYTEAATRVLALIERGVLAESAVPQDESRATYSVWRGPQDYAIDWAGSAERIRRFVDAVGWPYEGARTTYGGETLLIDEVSIVPDLEFEERHTGKIWRLDEGRPVVICGAGMVRIEHARTLAGGPAVFPRVREQLGR